MSVDKHNLPTLTSDPMQPSVDLKEELSKGPQEQDKNCPWRSRVIQGEAFSVATSTHGGWCLLRTNQGG